MEIHPPSGHVSSPREFLIHMSMITMGILIALSLEGIREWFHHKSLVSEAKATLATEIKENKERLAAKLERNSAARKNIEAAVAAVDHLLKTGKLNTNEMKVGYETVGLQESAWKTASITGAVGHMSYSDVKSYSDLYGMQEQFTVNQRRGVETLPSIMKSFHGVDDPAKMSREDLLRFKDRSLDLLGILQLEDSIAAALNKLYERTLAGK